MASLHVRKRALTVAATASALAFMAVGAPSAQAAPTSLGKLSDYLRLPAGVHAQISQNRWFVQTSNPATAKGGNADANRSQQEQVKNNAKAKGIDVKVDAQYTDLWNGMAVTVNGADVPRLAALPGVTRIFPILTVNRPDPVQGTTKDVASQIMTGVNIAQNTYGLTGKDIKVGVIDSGIDLDHPDLGGNGVAGQAPFPNKRVKWGYDFVGDKYDASGKQGSKTPVPDAVPDDCGGHGSHVAGIIGGNGDPAKGGVRGVAPEVQFGAYRVFGCEGNVDDDIILQAMERAGNDKMDIVNMSLGWSLATWPGYPQAVMADALADKGTIVVDAMGNDGEKGLFTGGNPGVGAKSIAVASVENKTVTTHAFQVNGRTVGYSAGENVTPPTSGTLDIVSAGPDATVTAGTEPVGGCDAAGAYSVDPTGKALLVKRGSCSFYEKALKAQKAGAKAVIIYNRDDTMLSPSLTGAEPITIPVYIITNTDGNAIQGMLKSGKGTLQYGNFTSSSANPSAGLISTFSSYGLAADLTTKPDVAAPGGNIWSTYPLEKGGYTNMSGTSMATPHVVGTVALMLQARPQLKGQWQQVRDLLQNSATPLAFHLKSDAGTLDSVQVQGAGLINVVASLQAPQTVTPGKLSVGDDGIFAKHTQTLTLTNNSGVDATYALTNVGAVATSGDTGNPQFTQDKANVTMPKSVFVRRHSSTKVTVTVAAPAGAVAGEIYGGYIQFTSGDKTVSVPYSGMAGNYQNLPVLQNATDGTKLPALGTFDKDKNNVTPVYSTDKATYDTKDNPMAVAFHLEYPVSGIQYNVYSVDANGNRTLLGLAGVDDMLGRDDSWNWITWNGTYVPSANPGDANRVTAPAGDYQFELKVQTAQPNPQDKSTTPVYQTWSTPTFHLNP